MIDLRNAIKEIVECSKVEMNWKDGTISGKEKFPFIKHDIRNAFEVEQNGKDITQWTVRFNIFDKFLPNCDFEQSIDNSREKICAYTDYLKMLIKLIETKYTKTIEGNNYSQFQRTGQITWRLFPAPQTEHRLFVVYAEVSFIAIVPTSCCYSDTFDLDCLFPDGVPKWIK